MTEKQIISKMKNSRFHDMMCRDDLTYIRIFRRGSLSRSEMSKKLGEHLGGTRWRNHSDHVKICIADWLIACQFTVAM